MGAPRGERVNDTTQRLAKERKSSSRGLTTAPVFEVLHERVALRYL